MIQKVYYRLHLTNDKLLLTNVLCLGASYANPSNNIPGPFNVTFPNACPNTVNVVHGNQYNYITNTVPMAERQAQPNVHTLVDTMRAESFNFSTNDSEISLKIPKEPKATVGKFAFWALLILSLFWE